MPALLPTLRRALVLDWSQLTLGMAARLAPALALVLAAGLAARQPAAGAVAAGGALIVGFGAFQQFTRSHAGPMLFALAGIGAATILGTLLGNSDVALVLGAVVFGFWCGLLPAIGMGAFWVGQQTTFFLLVAGAYPGGIEPALARAALVLAGGAVQIACYAAIAWAERGAPPRPSLRGVLGDGAVALSGLRYHIRLRSPYFRFALRVALALGVAVEIERLMALPNGYWVALTTLILLRPDFQDLMHRGLGRVGGTLLGAALATAITHVAAPGPVALACLVALFAFLAYASVRLNFGVFATFVTAYVVFLLVLAGVAAPRVATARIEGTILGGAIALAAQVDFYLRGRARRNQAT